MLWKCCTQYANKCGKLTSGHRTGKGQFSFQSQRKVIPKNAQTTAQLHSSKYSCLANPMDGGTWYAAVHGVAKSRTRLSDFTFTFHFHALEKEMATHSSVLAWRIPETGAPGGLPSLWSHRVRHDWSDLAAAAAAAHASKVMLKILQARLQQYMNCELSDVQAGFRKGKGTRDQIANIRWIMEKAREVQKNTYFCFIVMPKPLTVWITINCGKFFKRWEYQTTWPASWETYMQVKKQQLELDMEQQTGSK